MIHGSNRIVRIIVANILPGYSNFTDEKFQRSFLDGEPLCIYYPPDHLNAGQKYPYTALSNADSQAQGTNYVGTFVVEHPRFQTPTENGDIIQPYQKEVEFHAFFSPVEGVHPALNGTGFDCFIFRGSIVEGAISGARRFYDGPFKGFTVETQDGCQVQGEDVVPSKLDGSGCQGYLKGSFYESGYSPSKHDVFNYLQTQSWVVDQSSPLNVNFMAGTPFNFNMNWLSIRNRRERPVPYRMTSPNASGHAAILISPKHAIVSGHYGYGYPLRFYSPSEGLITRTIAESTATIGPHTSGVYSRDFRNMWYHLGFANPESDAITSQTYIALMNHFADCTILTMNDAVPFDVEPISIIDKATSETFVWSLIIGQEARGHLAYNCSPQTNTTQWFFSPCMNCDINANESIFPPNCGQEDVGLVMCMGDSGSPAITYYRGKPVFTGMLTNTTYTEGQLKYYPDEKQVMVQNSVMNEKCATYSTINYARAGQSSFGEFVGGRGIGSSTMYPLGWGQQISPIQFLNLWLGREGYHANTVSMKRERTDTSFTYPSPDIQYRQDPIPLKPDGRIDDTPISVLTEQNQTA